MTETATLARLAAEARQADATRFDTAGQALMATVRGLSADERFLVLRQLPFLDQATIASLFARNVLEAAKAENNSRAETRAWKKEAAAVARFMTCRPFSPLYLNGTQEALDRFKDQLRYDPDFFDAAHEWQRMSADQKDQTVLTRLGSLLEIMNETYGERMEMPAIVIKNFSEGDGDLGGYTYDPVTGRHQLTLYLQNAPYGLFGRLACAGHELVHAMQVHRGLQPKFDPALMLQDDYNILYLSAHNERYSLYLPYGTYGKVAYRRQPTEVESFMATDQIYGLATEFYDAPMRPRHSAPEAGLIL